MYIRRKHLFPLEWIILPIQKNLIMVGAKFCTEQGRMAYKAFMKRMPWKIEAMNIASAMFSELEMKMIGW